MTSPKVNMRAVVKARLKEETTLRSVSIGIAAAILFALNTSANAQLKPSNDDAVRAAAFAAARQACVTHQETALIDDLVRNCEHLARGPAFAAVQYSAWQRCAISGLMGTIDSPKRLKWLRASQAEKNRMCLDAVEEAKNNRNNPNALSIYKPYDEPTGTRTNRRLKSDVRPLDKPPIRLTQIDECIQYKCGDDGWKAKQNLLVLAAPESGSARLGGVAPGTSFKPLTAAWVTIEPMIFKVNRGWVEGGGKAISFAPGDLIYLYTHWGEGCFTFWTKGHLYGYFDEGKRPGTKNQISCISLPDENIAQVSSGKSELWYKLRLSNGTIGWIKSEEGKLLPN